jgi:pimeloyl-ACP methyl ester carboxylesterase
MSDETDYCNVYSGIGLLAKILGLTLALAGVAMAGERVRAGTVNACSALENLRIEDTNLLSATVVPAEEGLPEYCRVLGFVRPAINFEVRLPTVGWNEKFYMAGCGGYCGRISMAMNSGLRRNYAVSTMDAGHWSAGPTDGQWAYHNRVAEVDYGYRAVTETARVSKALLQAFYQAQQKRSYFNGCSNGGRQALMEAWRYPDDFDGIISGAPALDLTGLLTHFAWVVQANTGPDGKDILPRSKVNLIEQAVVAACDAKDGLKDGVIDDPRACDFKPASLRCQKADSADCLTAAEVTVLEKWYGGVRNSRGETLYPGGIPYGSEPFWWIWLTGRDERDEPHRTFGRGRFVPELAVNYFRYMAFQEDPGESFHPVQFDFDKDPPLLRFMGEIYNATNPDLSKFKARGGKLLMWHGWQDAIVTPERTVQYYLEVEKQMGGRGATQEFLRLFMVPGMDHCGDTPGPGIDASGFDPLTVLEEWVEKGVPPMRLLTTKKDGDGKTVWTRPLCLYPQRAKYRGKGDPNDAANFDCIEPRIPNHI